MRPVEKNSFFFALLNVSVYIHDALSEEIWRYSSQEGDGTLFSTRNLIVLEHFGSYENVDWCYPNDCYLKNKSHSSTILHCPKPGLHLVGPVTSSSDNQTVRYIQVVNDPFYYEWYLSYHKQPRTESQEEFRLWIVDPKHVSESEHNRTASFPSQFSKELTAVFFELGQKPLMKAKLGYRFIEWDKWKIYNKSFFTSEGYWQFMVSSVVNRHTIVGIDGQSVALHDRFIRRSSVQLLKTRFTFSSYEQQSEVILVGRNPQQYTIVQDPCAPHIAVLISSKCFITQDNFASVKEMKVPSSFLKQSEAVVKSVVFSAKTLVVLLESGRLLVFNGTTQSWNDPSGVPHQGFSGLSTQRKCFEGAAKNVMKGLVLGWTNESGSNTIYISSDGGFSFQQLPLPVLSVTNVSIEHVELHCLSPVVTFLLNSAHHKNQQKMLFIQYNLMDEEWQEQQIHLPDFMQESPVSFLFVPPSTQFVIVWSQKSFAFGRLNETGRIFMVKRQDNLIEFKLGANETIMSVTAGGHGDFAVQLSNNRMFYGKAFIEHVVEVYTGENSSSSFTAMFDMLNSLLLITFEGERVHSRKLPLKNEVLNAVYPHTSCPYLRFTTNITPELHFIDKGDKIEVWAELIHQGPTPIDIRLEISNVDVLRIVTEDRIEYYPGIITRNKTLTFIYEVRNATSSQQSPYRSSAVSVQLLPSVGELTCENEIQVLHMYVGCPLTKSIVIRNCTAPADEGAAPILFQVHDQSGQLACHLNGNMDEPLKLTVDLYEEGRFVQEIKTDYVVWEKTGRMDFGYTATMSEVGCVRAAQTWREVVGNYSGDLSNVWTQNNYQSCFERGENDGAFDGSKPYEILNSAGPSYLMFKGSGSFHFTLRVVGVHLSFCELSTQFSVDVASSEGKDNLPQLLSVLVATLGSTVLLYISFAYYTKQTLHRHQENEEEQQRLQELKSLLTAFQQGTDDKVLAYRRSTGHSVRRFTGTAMLMNNKFPKECFAQTDLMLESSEPSDVPQGTGSLPTLATDKRGGFSLS